MVWMMEEEKFTLHPRKHAVPSPKQSAFGTSLNFTPGTTKWAISLRNIGLSQGDPYGRPVLSVVLNHHRKGAEKAAKGLLNRIAEKYKADRDDKVFATINAFKEHVPRPSLDDYKQLDEVLHQHSIRVARNIPRKLHSKTPAADDSILMQAALAPPPITSAPSSRKRCGEPLMFESTE